jgi:hypothetical protein
MQEAGADIMITAGPVYPWTRLPLFEEIGEGFRVTVTLDLVASGVNAPVNLNKI